MSFAAKLKQLVDTVDEQTAYIQQMKLREDQYRDNMRLVYTALIKSRGRHENERTIVENEEFPMMSTEDLVTKDPQTLFATVGTAFGCILENLAATRKEIMAMSRELDSSYDKVMTDWERVRSGGKGASIADNFRKNTRPQTPEQKGQPTPLVTPPASNSRVPLAPTVADTTNKEKSAGKKSSDQPKTPTTTLEKESAKKKK